MLLTVMLPAFAAAGKAADDKVHFNIEKVENGPDALRAGKTVDTDAGQLVPKGNVRVSIVLSDKATLENGFASKGAFIGMSWGGLYTFRFAETHPECVACIYADAPVCDLAFELERRATSFTDVVRAYGKDTLEEMASHPLSPVNNHSRIAESRIPVLMLLGMADDVVRPESNGLLLAERLASKGLHVDLVKRDAWGHHPHGLDNPSRIVNFILRHTLNIQFGE